MKNFLSVGLTVLLFSSSAVAKTSPLNKCISAYCNHSCQAVSSCGYQAASQIRSCNNSCRPSARTSLAKKGSRALSTCRANDKAFRALSCPQIGSLLGYGGSGGGGTKR